EVLGELGGSAFAEDSRTRCLAAADIDGPFAAEPVARQQFDAVNLAGDIGIDETAQLNETTSRLLAGLHLPGLVDGEVGLKAAQPDFPRSAGAGDFLDLHRLR